MNHTRLLSSLLFCVIFYVSAAAQSLYNLTALPLDNLSAFRKPAANWQLAGSVYGSFNDAVLKTRPGSGVLVNSFEKSRQYQPEANLFTNLEHGDVYIEMDFMLPKGSNSGIYLQSRYEIQLADSWGVQQPKVSDCGSIYERWDESLPEGKKGYEGHPARTNACFAPGLWQHLAIQFQAPRFNASGNKIENARFIKVVLNGVVLHENVLLTGPTRSAAFTDEKPMAPLMVQGDHGAVYFKNIKYALLNDFAPKLTNLSYEYYEGKDFENYSQVQTSQLVRKGSTDALDARLADARDNFYILFNGSFKAETSDTYTFLMRSAGVSSLEIDGKPVIVPKWTWLGGETLRGEIPLSAGEHTVKIQVLKHFGWSGPGLGLFVQKPNTKSVALQSPASLPELPPTPQIEVQPSSEPQLLRSFMMHKGRKRTHVISVGDPAETHYAYDLRQASLLQVWKGSFLNTTEMWYERGEPQTAEALGATILLPGKCPLAIVSDKNAALPDTLNDATELLFKGYHLDHERYPVFHYAYRDIKFDNSFALNQNGKGLTCLLSIRQFPANGTLLARLAEGSKIEEVAPGIFAVNDQQYYLQIPPSPQPRPFVREANGKKELITEVSKQLKTPVVVMYHLFW